ncbi:MAG TPA: PadR family transcriptional regulator, partial [Candidatus Dormibacteraeota bacterium]|nr:PadR family transcriptional regulator [Candidatus Dormibacteraeota bacterium]
MEEEADEPQQFTRAPGRSARLDLALLGLIAEVPGISGYGILKIFDLSMTHYWHAYPSQIYPTLDQM